MRRATDGAAGSLHFRCFELVSRKQVHGWHIAVARAASLRAPSARPLSAGPRAPEPDVSPKEGTPCRT